MSAVRSTRNERPSSSSIRVRSGCVGGISRYGFIRATAKRSAASVTPMPQRARSVKYSAQATPL